MIVIGSDSFWIGLTFYRRSFYLFLFLFRHGISELHQLITGKFCTMVCSRPNCIMPVQNFSGPSLKEIYAPKILQNLAWFWAISNFDGENLWNGWRYSKSDKYLIYRDSSLIRRLWVISGCADVAMGKRWIKSADAKCGCVGKRRMCGQQLSCTLPVIKVVEFFNHSLRK